MHCLEGFGAIFGRAESALDGTFLFSVRAVGDEEQELSVLASDFQDKVWHAAKGLHELDNLREEVGIGKALADFVPYLREALTAGSVRMTPVGSSKCNGADTVKLVAQKAKGAPLISLTLKKVVSTEAKGLLASYATSLFEGYRQLRADLDRERARSSEQSNSLAKMRAKVDTLEMELQVRSSLGASPGHGRQKRARSPSPPRYARTQSPPPSLMQSGLLTQSLFATSGTMGASALQDQGMTPAVEGRGTVAEATFARGAAHGAPGGEGGSAVKSKKRPAMVSKRIRNRGTKISTADEEDE